MKMESCSSCGAPNSIQRQVCFNCGSLLRAVPQASQPGETGISQARPAGLSGKATFVDVLAGSAVASGMAIAMMVIGAILSLTGIGAIIGIPMLIIGFVGIFIGPIIGGLGGALGAKRNTKMTVIGPCPYCQAELTAWGLGFDCPVCGQRIREHR